MCFQTHSKHIALISIIRNICHLFPPLVFHQTFFWYQGKHQWMFLLFCFSRHWCKPCRVNGYRVRKVDIANQCDKVQNLDVTVGSFLHHMPYIFQCFYHFLLWKSVTYWSLWIFNVIWLPAKSARKLAGLWFPYFLMISYSFLTMLPNGNELQIFAHNSSFCSQMEKNIKFLLLLDVISFLNLTIIIFQFLDASSKIQMK